MYVIEDDEDLCSLKVMPNHRPIYIFAQIQCHILRATNESMYILTMCKLQVANGTCKYPARKRNWKPCAIRCGREHELYHWTLRSALCLATQIGFKQVSLDDDRMEPLFYYSAKWMVLKWKYRNKFDKLLNLINNLIVDKFFNSGGFNSIEGDSLVRVAAGDNNPIECGWTGRWSRGEIHSELFQSGRCRMSRTI